MKTSYSFHALVVTAAMALSHVAQAQTSGVPGFISYQGQVLNASGSPVGAGTPVSRSAIFRIWDHPSNTLVGNLVYSEQQTITISEGEFSVLVGQGVATTTTQFGYSEAAKKLTDVGQAFSGPTRYLGVTVDDGTATADNEITPRQQVVSAAFAMRSKVAETLATSTGTALTVLDNGNIGVSNPGAPARFTVTGANSGTTGTPQFLITDSVDTTKRLRIGVDNTGTGTGFIQSFKEGTGVQNLLLNPSGGSVGIGKTPGVGIALDVNGAITASGAVTAASFSGSGANLHSLPAGNLTGTVADARLSTNVALKNAANNFTAANTFASVGVGASPSYPLHVSTATNVSAIVDSSSTIGTWLGLRNTTAGGTTWNLISTGSGNGEGAGKLLLTPGSPGFASGIVMTLTSSNVGIGTTNPFQAKLVVNGGVNTDGLSGAYVNAAVVGNRVTHGTHPISIMTSGSINCGHTLIATSDQRIKNIEGKSNGEGDLRTLMGIEVTDFRYKDVIAKGDGAQKKVIAQQLEKVFPQAVSQHTDFIPDIYRKAAVKKGWIHLETKLNQGEVVRLINAKDEESQHEVLETAKGRFRVANFTVEDGQEVFVYGRQVKDFRSVDYDAISMLNVSATQQIKKEKDEEIKALRDENAALRERLSELEAKDKAQEKRLAAIEKSLLNAGQTVAIKTSAKRAE